MHIETTIPSQKKTRYKLLSYYVFFTSKFAAYTDKHKQQWSNSKLTIQNKTYIATYIQYDTSHAQRSNPIGLNIFPRRKTKDIKASLKLQLTMET